MRRYSSERRILIAQRRRAALVAADGQVVQEGVPSLFAHVRVLVEIEAGGEARGRIVAGPPALLHVVEHRVVLPEIGDDGAVERRVEPRGDAPVVLGTPDPLAQRRRPAFLPADAQVVQEGVDPLLAHVGVLFQVEAGGEVRGRILTGPPAFLHVVEHRVRIPDVGDRVSVERGVECRGDEAVLLGAEDPVAQRRRAALVAADGQVVQERVDSLFAHVGVLVEIEAGGEVRGRVVAGPPALLHVVEHRIGVLGQVGDVPAVEVGVELGRNRAIRLGPDDLVRQRGGRPSDRPDLR